MEKIMDIYEWQLSAKGDGGRKRVINLALEPWLKLVAVQVEIVVL